MIRVKNYLNKWFEMFHDMLPRHSTLIRTYKLVFRNICQRKMLSYPKCNIMCMYKWNIIVCLDVTNIRVYIVNFQRCWTLDEYVSEKTNRVIFHFHELSQQQHKCFW